MQERWIDDVMLEAAPTNAGYGGYIWLGTLKTTAASKGVCVDGSICAPARAR